MTVHTHAHEHERTTINFLFFSWVEFSCFLCVCIDKNPFTVGAQTELVVTWHQLGRPIKSITARAAVYLCMHTRTHTRTHARTHTLYTLLISSAAGLGGLRAPADNILFGHAAQSCTEVNRTQGINMTFIKSIGENVFSSHPTTCRMQDATYSY